MTQSHALREGGGGLVTVNGPTGKPHVQVGALEDGGQVRTLKLSGATIWASTHP